MSTIRITLETSDRKKARQIAKGLPKGGYDSHITEALDENDMKSVADYLKANSGCPYTAHEVLSEAGLLTELVSISVASRFMSSYFKLKKDSGVIETHPYRNSWKKVFTYDPECRELTENSGHGSYCNFSLCKKCEYADNKAPRSREVKTTTVERWLGK